MTKNDHMGRNKATVLMDEAKGGESLDEEREREREGRRKKGGACELPLLISRATQRIDCALSIYSRLYTIIVSISEF